MQIYAVKIRKELKKSNLFHCYSDNEIYGFQFSMFTLSTNGILN